MALAFHFSLFKLFLSILRAFSVFCVRCLFSPPNSCESITEGVTYEDAMDTIHAIRPSGEVRSPLHRN